MPNKPFSPAEILILSQNPYVVSVNANRISYSLAFKELAIRKSCEGLTSVKIFREAGFDVEMLGKIRIYSAMKKFKKEAVSPDGLHESRSKSREKRLEQLAKEDLAKKQTKTAIRELQERIVHLEQQIEFLKKTRIPRD